LKLEEILMKRKGLRRKLSARDHLKPIRIAVLGGSTTNELVDLWELWLLESGFAPVFYQSEYGRFYVEAVHDPEKLVAFQPDIVYVHTSYKNLQGFAPLQATEPELDEQVKRELGRFEEIWNSITEKIGCHIIQNNFEFPPYQILGNLDATQAGGHTRFITQLNLEFAKAAAANAKLAIQDICSISARIGLDRWFDWERYFSYKVLTTAEGSQAMAVSLNAMVRGMYGKTRKVLVLDLDNTLWGGVIGDDGVDKIAIGRETPVAEAYTAFQEYCLSLRNRGILLAVCSKNNEDVAKSGFEHPDSVLKLEHISCFKANWSPKHENIALIAKELNLGADSFVFVDDNPAERAIVEAQVDGIAVPNVGKDVAQYAGIIEAGRYFEQTSFSKEDIDRAALYQENAIRASFESKFADYGEYLDSLEMSAEIEPFNRLYIERITQLTNKTNQFNLTTRRYTLAEMEAVLTDPHSIGLYGKLSDRFGDNGLISIVLGRRDGDVLDIELWLMSCRVLKRDMEIAMLDALVERAVAAGVKTLRASYIPTKKNGMVADHYPKLGFTTEAVSEDGSAVYSLDIVGYRPRNTHIKVLELVHE
jgi:FkbH-like protein